MKVTNGHHPDIELANHEAPNPSKTAKNGHSETSSADDELIWHIKKRHIFVVLITMLTLMIIFYLFGNAILKNLLWLMMAYSNWMIKYPFIGIFLYMLIFITIMVWLIPPGLLVALGAFTFVKMFGHLYGLLLLTLIVYICTHTGIHLTYYIGRYGCSIGNKLAKKYKHFDVLNHLVKTRGIKITVLLRFVQVIPYPIINYIMSVTDIPLWDYFIGNHAWVTDALIYTYLGLSMNSVSDVFEGKTPMWKIGLIIFSMVWLVMILYYVIKRAQKELDQMIDEDGAGDVQDDDCSDLDIVPATELSK